MKKVDLGNNSFFYGKNFEVGKNFSIGRNTVIKAHNFKCGDDVTIGTNNNFLIGDKIEIGDCSYIGNDNIIAGLVLKFGDYLYLDSGLTIGHGGKFNYDSNLIVGNHCMLCSKSTININYQVEIGDDVGIGENVDIWTHGSFPPVLDGFPAQFGRIKIGSNVWLPAKSTVMPGIEIGNNVVIGANSVINKNLPAGSLCAGIPAKVLREDQFPKSLSKEEKGKVISTALIEYDKLLKFKKLDKFYDLDLGNLTIETDDATFYFDDMTIHGNLSEKEEDLRDFLRRRGMKFFTGKPFKSIIPEQFQSFMDD